MESNKNNKKKNKNYYKYHNNHNKFYNKNNNHNNKKFHYYKDKNKNKQSIVIDNNQNKQENQNINILLNNEQQVNQINQSIQENNQEITKDSPEQEYQRPIQQVIKENSADYEELEFVPVKKGQRVDFNDKPGFLKYALGFALLVVLVFGVSYSFFNYRQEDSRQGDIASGEVYVTLDGNTQTLTLNKMYPRTTEEARARNDNYIDFTIRGKNTSETKEINSILSIANGDAVSGKTRINPQYLMLDLQEKVNNEYTYVKNAVPLSSFSYNYVVPVNTTTEIVKEYRLRVWVSDSIIISDTEANATYTQAEFANLYATLKVEINSQDQTYVQPPAAAQHISTLLTDTNAAGNKIYTGSSPANYVTFNGESWRILGVYGDKLKIVKATPLAETQKWQNSTADGNAWNGSLLETYLNTTYYNSLNQTAKEMIAEGSWDVGACSHDVAANAAYTCAHATTLTGADTNSNRVKVGLIASYEYLYAAENDGTCWTTSGFDYDGGCHNKDWLYGALTNNESSHAWTLSPLSDSADRALYVRYGGYVHDSGVARAYAVSPVVYLKSDVTITGGDGESQQTAYTLSYSVN